MKLQVSLMRGKANFTHLCGEQVAVNVLTLTSIPTMQQGGHYCSMSVQACGQIGHGNTNLARFTVLPDTHTKIPTPTATITSANDQALKRSNNKGKNHVYRISCAAMILSLIHI